MSTKITIEEKTKALHIGSVSGIDLSEFVVIKVGDKNRIVHQEVLTAMTGMESHIEKLKKENKGYKLMFGKIQAGENVNITGEDSMMFAHEKMKMEFDINVRSGMTGWISKYWRKLCSLQCDCGALISYDVLRRTNELMCDDCAGSHCH